MKTFYIASLFVVWAVFSNAQNNSNSDCINAIPLCSTPNFTFNATSGVGTVTDIPQGSNISNPSTNPASANSGCLLSGELKPQWLIITIGNAGFLEFVFGSNSSAHPQAGYYDWAMWPYNANTCNAIQNNTLPPLRCNWNASSAGGTGIASGTNIPSGGIAGNYEPPLAVNSCQQYIICISNYSGVNTLVSFLSMGTASLTCNPSCLNVNSPTLCAGSSATILANSSGNLGGISFSMNPGAVVLTSTVITISPTVSTNYTIYATGLNSQSVAVTQTAVSQVTVFPQPVVAPTTTQSTCSNSISAFDLGLSFIPTNAATGYTVIWSTLPLAGMAPNQTSGSGVIIPGIYSATVYANGGCYSVASFTINPRPSSAIINLSPAGPQYIVNCFQPTVTVQAIDAGFSYTWTNGTNAPQLGASASFDVQATGVWTIHAINPTSGCTASKTITVLQSTLIPNSAITPTFQNITCNLSSIVTITATALTPSVNLNHTILSPLGGTFSSGSQIAQYTPGGPGVYTHILQNTANGCSFSRTFTITSNQGFPTFNVSSLQNFTLGCSSKSVAVININNGSATNSLQVPNGGPVSYTILAPGASSATPSGTLSAISNYSVNSPGTYTVITKDNTSMCETRLPISIISNTVGPKLDTLIVPRTILDCNTSSVQLQGISSTTNVTFNWAYDTNTGNLASNSITVNANFTVAPTNTLVDQYTLTITDASNLCITTTVVAIYQNLFPPKALITNGGLSALSCKTQTLMLNNSSTSNIPTVFPGPGVVVGYIWKGPSPMLPEQNVSTYVASIPGTYTMIAKDLGNGCTSQTVISISDFYEYPVLIKPNTVPLFTLDCGSPTVGIYPGVVGPNTNLTYNWTAPSEAATGPANSSTLSTNKIGLYRVLMTNSLSGCAISAEAKVINGTLTVGFTADQLSGFAPLAVSFNNGSSSSSGTNSIISAWNFGNGTHSITTSASVSPYVEFKTAGNYTVWMFGTKGSCIDTASLVISVELTSQLEIPNVFTPNGDNINDLFFLKAASLAEITMLIYDRWGHKVYELLSLQGNVAWDGTNQFGKEVAEGVYFYVIKAKGKDGKEFEKKGTVSLFR